ncbi:Sulfur carrier protein ThiS [compost metagenome]|uniref:Sulfur carrier protein n=1 Tax=Paenibacillus typhae TaxID=1174501 RepID=A0A1G8T603_9BACL|nr:sulfur carrier protein ThiS [Paenibacillus typhae]MBY0008832.1 sulfur carrier protein ThiS [Paenibacillus typhae]SDJ36415.1 sulfur carrier protein [Paenibacillus typhae]
MNLIVNGKAEIYQEDCRTVADLLNLPAWNRRLVIVELNGEIVAREDYTTALLGDGDRIEVVHFVGGG